MRTKLIRKEQKNQRSIYENSYILLVLLFWCRDSILPLFRAVLLEIFEPGADLLIPLLFSVAVVFALPYMIRKLRAMDLLFFILVVAAYLLHYFIFPDNQYFLLYYAFTFLGTCVPLYFVGLGLDVPDLRRKLHIASLISVWVNLVYYLFVRTTSNRAVTYGDMNAAYNMLPHVCWIACNMFERPKALNICSLAAGSFLLFSMGSRGPVLCLLALICLYLLFFKKYKRPTVSRTIIILLFIIFAVFFTPAVKWLSELSKDIGLSTRIFERITENTFFSSQDRNYIRESLIASLSERPLIGYGFAGDRVLLNKYAHNLWLELCVTFGYPLGCILFFAVVCVILMGFLKASSGEERAFMLTLTCSCMFKLMVSGSFLDENGLFLLLGICVASIRRSQANKVRQRIAGRRMNRSGMRRLEARG